MALSSVRIRQASYCARHRFRDGAERHAERAGDVAIAEALRTQVEAASIAFRDGAQHGAQMPAALVAHELFFRAGRWIDQTLRGVAVPVTFCALPALHPVPLP